LFCREEEEEAGGAVEQLFFFGPSVPIFGSCPTLERTRKKGAAVGSKEGNHVISCSIDFPPSSSIRFCVHEIFECAYLLLCCCCCERMTHIPPFLRFSLFGRMKDADGWIVLILNSSAFPFFFSHCFRLMPFGHGKTNCELLIGTKKNRKNNNNNKKVSE
jgi:hypothetical protein